MEGKLNILFICFANSVRSQMAEGIAKEILGTRINIKSIGLEPHYKVNQNAIQVMQEIGIDISQNYSKDFDDLSPIFVRHIDYIIFLCSEEADLKLSYPPTILHWPVKDPISVACGSQDERLKSFREARDTIRRLIEGFAWELGLVA